MGDVMKINSRDLIEVVNEGFVRDLYPAFNVSENMFGHKSQYTKQLYYSKPNSKPIKVFFVDGVIQGRIIKKREDSFDFIISNYDGKGYIVKNKNKGVLIKNGHNLKGYIIYDIDNRFVNIIDWMDKVDWSKKQMNNSWDDSQLTWNAEDDVFSNIEEQDNVIENLYSWLSEYEADYFEEVAINGKSQKIEYLKGMIQSVETCIDAIQRGGVEKGLDAISRIYFSNAKQSYNKKKKQGKLDEYYDSSFYYSAGLVFGFREVIEHISGFPEDWQYAWASESFTPPASAVSNAKKGLELRKKWGRGGLSPAEAKSQGIDSGVTRARKISSGKVSRHDVRRMSAFNRHRKNYNPSKKKPDGGPTAGTIAWLLWGGTPGVNWAKKKSAAMGAESFEAETDEATLKKYQKTYGTAGAKVRLKLKNKIMKQNTHGTKSGQWSARKSQKLNKEYEEAMEKKGNNPYKSSTKTKAQKNLKDWGDQKWITKSGKKSSVTGERYLPSKAIKALSDKEYKKTTAAKRKAMKAGKQFSKQPKEIAKKVAAYRAEIGTQGPCWDGYTYVGPKPYAKGSCVKEAEYTPDHEMSDYTLQDLSKSSVVEGDFAVDSLKLSYNMKGAENTSAIFKADATSCFECGKKGYTDEMRSIEFGYLCARCSNPHVDFSKIYESEGDSEMNESPLVKNIIAVSGLAFAIIALKGLKS